ncbi:efflux RND transporter periplasmic adaptor subunit [Novosphingobium sp. 1949]|uniref:Efflux RND transporter periplasmic adaptor subunit n=1 Tax=Novosphingobium organovorum TaxID=2930092 RepID=A0ABT0BCA1_9SPHN|nr:efflux RND transporter periplasmic adaptor subunit [Novosphingobium organovorum]MCJ2182682.1 efflux RND transporter periplasmic adaptor subunit [Novosphingobium organovorum]
MRSTFNHLAAASVLCLATVSLSACGQQGQQHQARTVEVGVVTLKTEPVTLSSQLTGRVAATTVAEVRPQVAGIIKARLFEEGSYVHEGQALYQIDPRLYSADLDTARAQLESARADLASAQAKARRYAALGDSDAVSAQDKDDIKATARAAQAAVHQYEASVRTASVNLGFTKVYAPISGRIGRSLYTKGALVSASQDTAMATIQQLDPVYVDITQSSSDLLRLRKALAKGDLLATSANVSLELEDGTEYPVEGRVEFSEVSVDPDAGTVTIRARFPNPDNILLPGMFVRVKTPQGTVPNGLLVPQQAVSRDSGGKATVMVVSSENKVVQRSVTAAQAIGNKWLVTSGLKAGEKVIVEGTDKVQAGASVKPVETKLDN